MPDTTPDTTPDSVVRIDLTDDTTLAASVAALDDTTRDRLTNALRDHANRHYDAKILDAVRAVLAEDLAVRPGSHTDDNPVVGVVFHSMEWDNGYFLCGTGNVVMRDGSSHDLDFDIDDLLTDGYGSTGAIATLAVDLRTGTLEFDEYGSQDTAHQHFNISEPRPAHSPDDPATLAWWRDHGGMPDDLTIDGHTFPDPAHAIGYLILKAMSAEEVLYLARSNPQRLADRRDRLYVQVANADIDPTWVPKAAAHVAFANAWIDQEEYIRLSAT